MSSQQQGDHAGYQQDHAATVPPHAAATATETAPIYVAERACRLKKVDVYSLLAVTGANTDYTSLQVSVNGVAKGNVFDMTSGNNLAAGVKKNIYAPTTPLALAAGDVVGLVYTKTGNGLLVPALFVRIVTDFEP